MATLAVLRTRAQEESDNVNQTFVANSDWLSFINAAYAEVYGLITTAFGNDYYTQSPVAGYTFSTDGVNERFALPTAFFKLRGVDVLYGGTNQYVSINPFAFAHRNRFNITGSSVPASGQTVRVFYIPKVTLLAVDADVTIDLQNDWEEYIVVDAALRAVAKEESDVSVLMMRKQALVQRINEEAENRDASQPMGIVDTRGRGSPGMAYRLDGVNIWLIGQRVNGWPGNEWADGWGY